METSGLTVWLTGLPGAGKTTSARYLHGALTDRGISAVMLDGDLLRQGVSSDLGFSEADRAENVRRAGEIALLLAQQGFVVVVSLISPRRAARDAVRHRHESEFVNFIEVHIAAPIEVCEDRDPKSLYRLAKSGHLSQMTGIDDVYEAPLRPEVRLPTGDRPVEETGGMLVNAVLEALDRSGALGDVVELAGD